MVAVVQGDAACPAGCGGGGVRAAAGGDDALQVLARPFGPHCGDPAQAGWRQRGVEGNDIITDAIAEAHLPSGEQRTGWSESGTLPRDVASERVG